MRKFYFSRLRFVSAPIALVSITLLGSAYLGFVLWSLPEYTCLVRQPTLAFEPEVQSNGSHVLPERDVTSRFRDALARMPNEKLITAWTSAGWSNDIISAVNLIYIAMNVGRTPVLPPFVSDHIGHNGEVWPLRFGDVFDLARLSDTLGIKILEWHDLKDITPGQGSEAEKIGCWSTWATRMEADHEGPRDSPHLNKLNLDVSYTPVPEDSVLHKDSHWVSLWKMASLSFSNKRQAALATQTAKAFPVTSGSGDILEPDDQLLCFDTLYWVGMLKMEEWWDEYAPFWRTVGTHIHWQPALINLAEDYLRQHFNLQRNETIPPFISVHVRRGDFHNSCPPDMSHSDCFAPSGAYARRVQEIRNTLRARPRGINVQHVLITSDERDPEWWSEIAALGPEWTWIDHGLFHTVEKHGKWYPTILDAVFHSMGAGFVGTDRSTVTLLAQRRVEDWYGGVSERVLWGGPDADDH